MKLLATLNVVTRQLPAMLCSQVTIVYSTTAPPGRSRYTIYNTKPATGWKVVTLGLLQPSAQTLG